MLRSLTFSAVAAASLAVSGPAFAQAIQVGVLECAGGTSVGLVLGSSAGLNCVFRPSTGRPAEGYGATLNRVGLDVGFTNNTAVGWIVFAPSRNVAKGALAGHYSGVSANASVGIGGGANVLVGGLNNSITLQPVSVQGQTGLNVAATVSNVELRSLAAASTGAKKKKSAKKRS